MALATNQGVTNWQVSPGGAMLEELCGRALCDLFGLAPSSDATFLYSGTYANQEALYLALHRHAERCGFDLAEQGVAGFEHPEQLTVLISEDAHFSIKHAVRMLGLGERTIVRLPLDSQRRIDVAKAEAIVAGLENRQIVCVIATAGTTSTGAVDPIGPLADLCERTGAWLHVDGAYGYAYQLVPEWSARFDGHERADSITWDPHKQLGVPIPNSRALCEGPQRLCAHGPALRLLQPGRRSRAQPRPQVAAVDAAAVRAAAGHRHPRPRPGRSDRRSARAAGRHAMSGRLSARSARLQALPRAGDGHSLLPHDAVRRGRRGSGQAATDAV